MKAQAAPVAEDRAAPEPAVLGPALESPRLAAVGLCKSWDKRVILDRVDLALEPGVVVGLLGANGVGKTTLLRILAGLIYAASGTVTLDGFDVRKDEREFKARLGFVPAGQTGLYARLTVQAQLEYWARIAFVPRRARPAAVERAIGRFGLEELRRRRVDRLSMGQRQRVRLAMGFLHDPTLVLLDEPQTSLDPAGLELLAEALTEFAAADGTAVWCAPAAGDIPLPVRRVYTLAEGSLRKA